MLCKGGSRSAVYLNDETSLQPGDKIRARVTHADEYELWAEAL